MSRGERGSGRGLRIAGGDPRIADSGILAAGRGLQLCDPRCHIGMVHRRPSTHGKGEDAEVKGKVSNGMISVMTSAAAWMQHAAGNKSSPRNETTSRACLSIV